MSCIILLSIVSPALNDVEGFFKLRCCSQTGCPHFQPWKEQVISLCSNKFLTLCFPEHTSQVLRSSWKFSCKVIFISSQQQVFWEFYIAFFFLNHYFCILLSSHFITFVLINPSNLTTINLSILKLLWIFPICCWTF